MNIPTPETASGTAAARRTVPVASRVAVSVEFVLMGAVTGGWASRIPDVKAHIGLDDAEWGLATTAVTAGSLISLFLTLALVARVGPRRLGLLGAAGLLVVAAVIGWTGSAAQLVPALVFQGMATGLLAPAMNAQAVEVERLYHRRIVSTFHAWFSAGQLAGGLVGAVAAQAGLRPGIQFSATALILLVLLVAVLRRLPADEPRVRSGPAGSGRPRRTLSPQLTLLCAIALLCSINEGVAVQWSAQYSAVALGAGAGVGALTFTAFSVAMAASRVFGDRIAGRFGERRFLQISEVVVALGLLGALLSGTVWAAPIGFALVGLGSACVVPTVMRLAARQPGLAPGQGVSVVSLGQWPAFLIGPPLIGLLAELVGLRWALLVVVAAAAGAVVAASWLRVPAGTTTEVAESGPTVSR